MRKRLLDLVAKLKSRLAREDGQDLVEYALIVTLIAVAAISGSRKVATAIGTIFTNISTSLG